jgi:hypothetical protein
MGRYHSKWKKEVTWWEISITQNQYENKEKYGRAYLRRMHYSW